MPSNLFRSTLTATGWGSLSAVLGYVLWTRKSQIYPLAPSDRIFNSTLFARYNPNGTPAMHDVCLRRVPMGRVREELLEAQERGDGLLVEKFCAGVWSGWGFEFQRRYLARKYRGPETASQLWDPTDLAMSTYPVGTQITDHFEISAKSPTSITVRCGDSPRNSGSRESDGLFEITAEVKKDEGVVEFGLKSAFFNGVAEKGQVPAGGPVGPWTQWAHQHYDRILMETGIKPCLK